MAGHRKQRKGSSRMAKDASQTVRQQPLDQAKRFSRPEALLKENPHSNTRQLLAAARKRDEAKLQAQPGTGLAAGGAPHSSDGHPADAENIAEERYVTATPESTGSFTSPTVLDIVPVLHENDPMVLPPTFSPGAEQSETDMEEIEEALTSPSPNRGPTEKGKGRANEPMDEVFDSFERPSDLDAREERMSLQSLGASDSDVTGFEDAQQFTTSSSGISSDDESSIEAQSADSEDDDEGGAREDPRVVSISSTDSEGETASSSASTSTVRGRSPAKAKGEDKRTARESSQPPTDADRTEHLASKSTVEPSNVEESPAISVNNPSSSRGRHRLSQRTPARPHQGITESSTMLIDSTSSTHVRGLPRKVLGRAPEGLADRSTMLVNSPSSTRGRIPSQVYEAPRHASQDIAMFVDNSSPIVMAPRATSALVDSVSSTHVHDGMRAVPQHNAAQGADVTTQVHNVPSTGTAGGYNALTVSAAGTLGSPFRSDVGQADTNLFARALAQGRGPITSTPGDLRDFPARSFDNGHNLTNPGSTSPNAEIGQRPQVLGHLATSVSTNELIEPNATTGQQPQTPASQIPIVESTGYGTNLSMEPMRTPRPNRQRPQSTGHGTLHERPAYQGHTQSNFVPLDQVVVPATREDFDSLRTEMRGLREDLKGALDTLVDIARSQASSSGSGFGSRRRNSGQSSRGQDMMDVDEDGANISSGPSSPVRRRRISHRPKPRDSEKLSLSVRYRLPSL
ncbi:hypothetical protein CERSUDRAFT_94978 [Gelatoporia subvermispora B]|uniref:Uncharacterized protein n=1 Tax=Ceriporiopsis subvermispora (strain B) TaxID=914234 RepID=M2RE25_CERS8|nr:hypothetical protein CERSUDRAFT_94978 [Gelatoporia subvermispora B]